MAKRLHFSVLLAVFAGVVGCSTSVPSDAVEPAPDAAAAPSPAVTPESPTSETDAAAPPPENPTAENPAATPAAADAAAPIATSLDGDTIEPATLSTVALSGLADEKGKAYGEVRQLLMQRGWVPHTFAETNGTPSDANDSRVQAMEALGYGEVKACAGTEQGLCRFEFVYENRTAENGPVLVVTTAAAADSSQAPTFWDYALEPVSDLSYIDRPFDPTLLTQLRNERGFCLGVGRCDAVQFMLKDALLVAGSGDFGSIKVSLFPNIPLSKADALAYARILDTDGVIDFGSSETKGTPNTETYYEAGLPPGGITEQGGVTFLRLELLPSGEVTEISLTTLVL